MDEKQILLFREINLREAGRTLDYWRTALNLMSGHIGAVNDAILTEEFGALEANITRTLDRIRTLQREAANVTTA